MIVDEDEIMITLLPRYIAAGAEDSSVRVLDYNMATTFRLGTLLMMCRSEHLHDADTAGNARCGRITSLQFGPDSLSLLAATEFGAVVLWRFDRE